jgi:benzoyl-CoA reductase/2-hydroxyglutaryl-CoA dehydratase subunit BcrC/BadD/HgdB
MKGQEYFKELRKKFRSSYNKELMDTSSNRKIVAHVTGFLPSEILVAMDIIPFYPETYATIACAFRAADELCLAAEKEGISRDVCAFSTVALGSMFTGKGPYGGMPKPDILISSGFTCGIHVPWWELMEKHYKVPHFIFDGPVLAADPTPRDIEFFISETKRMISFLEKQTGKSLDPDRLKNAVEQSGIASDYFAKIIDLRKSIPNPISSRQIVGDMYHVTTLPGTEETTQFYKELYEDTLEKTEKKTGIEHDEKFRLIWDNIPIWHDLELIEYFEERGMIFVYETYFTEYWAKSFLTDDIYESMALKYLTGWTNRRLDRKIEIMKNIVRDYHVDGIVVFENKGCRAYSTGQLDVAASLNAEFGIPYLTITGNMADPGGHDAEGVRHKVESFQELLESGSSARIDA